MNPMFTGGDFADAKPEHIVCGNCKAKAHTGTVTRMPEDWYFLEGPPGEAFFCGISCLMEMAWKLRESQPKLSKSKPLYTCRYCHYKLGSPDGDICPLCGGKDPVL